MPPGRVYLVYIAAAIWATIGPATRSAYAAGCSPLGLLLLRHVAAALGFVAGAALGVYGAGLLLDRAVAVQALGVMTPFYVSYAYAVEELGVARAAALLYTAPAWVLLYERLSHRSPGSAAVASAALVAFGALVLALEEGPSPGVVWGLASGAGYAASIEAARRLSRGRDPLGFAAAVQSLLLPGVVVASLAVGIVTVKISLDCVPYAIHLGIVVGHVAYGLFYKGLRGLPASLAAAAASLELLLSVLLGILLYGEPLTAHLALGSAMIAAGLILSSRS